MQPQAVWRENQLMHSPSSFEVHWVRLCRSSRVAIALLGAIGLVLLSSGCSLLQGPSSINTAISDALRVHEPDSSATLNLAKTVPGEWSRVLVLCSQPSAEKIDELLGFKWSKSGDVAESQIQGMLIFATDNEVVSLYSVGQDDEFENHFYFVPCDAPDGHTVKDFAPTALSRSEARLDFVFARSFGYWYVPAIDQ